MKQLLLVCLISSFLHLETTAQRIDPLPALTQQDYLAKSKRQQTAAWILLGAGIASLTANMLIPRGEYQSDDDSFVLFGESYKNDGIRFTFFWLGSASLTASLPLFLASLKNKRKAGVISLRQESIQVPVSGSFVRKQVPALHLAIPL